MQCRLISNLFFDILSLAATAIPCKGIGRSLVTLPPPDTYSENERQAKIVGSYADFIHSASWVCLDRSS